MASGWVYGIKAGLTVDASWELYQEAWLDDRDITLEDADEMAEYVLKIGVIWGPEIAMLMAAPVWPLYGVYAIAGAGLVASYAIGGQEGAEEYMEYITTPSRWGPTVRDQITAPIIEYIEEEIWEEQLVKPIGSWYRTQRRKVGEIDWATLPLIL